MIRMTGYPSNAQNGSKEIPRKSPFEGPKIEFSQEETDIITQGFDGGFFRFSNAAQEKPCSLFCISMWFHLFFLFCLSVFSSSFLLWARALFVEFCGAPVPPGSHRDLAPVSLGFKCHPRENNYRCKY